MNKHSINSADLKLFLELLKPFILNFFPLEKSRREAGRKPIGQKWLLIALGLYKSTHFFTWKSFAEAIKPCSEILASFGLLNSPSRSTLFKYFSEAPPEYLNEILTEIGLKMVKKSSKDLAIDSSGFQVKAGSIWRLLKWNKSSLKKSTKHFKKAHIIIDCWSKAVLGLRITASTEADIKSLLPLIKKVKIPPNEKKRLHGDKAYHDGELQNELAEKNIKMIVEPKKNFVDHGTDSFRDQMVRFYQMNSSLWHSTYRTHRKATVEHIFGVIKVSFIPVKAKKLQMQQKHILSHFLMYNLELYKKEVGK